MQAAAEKGKGNAGADSAGNHAVSHTGKGGRILRALPSGADHRHAPWRDPRAEMAGSESENRRASHLTAGAEGQRKGADLRTENEILQPHDSAAARNDRTAGRTENANRQRVDFPVPA